MGGEKKILKEEREKLKLKGKCGWGIREDLERKEKGIGGGDLDTNTLYACINIK